ncbi:MAG: hypothetical protein U0528_03340 [Anaerolineae bacterium]
MVADSNDVGYSTGRWASAEQEGEGVFADDIQRSGGTGMASGRS